MAGSVFKRAGKSLRKAYITKYHEDETSLVFSINTEGKLPSKAIYFVNWYPNGDPNELCQSIAQLVIDVMEKAVRENYQSIAFPAIGCGDFGCSIELVAQTFVKEVHQQLAKHSIVVSFVIQSDRRDIYNEFQRQIALFTNYKQFPVNQSMSVAIEKGHVEIVKGDITKQKVKTLFFI